MRSPDGYINRRIAQLIVLIRRPPRGCFIWSGTRRDSVAIVNKSNVICLLVLASTSAEFETHLSSRVLPRERVKRLLAACSTI